MQVQVQEYYVAIITSHETDGREHRNVKARVPLYFRSTPVATASI
jgi:hypothetical protein